MIRCETEDAMPRNAMNWRGTDRSGMDRCGMGQFRMDLSGMDRSGVDRIVPSPLRRPVDVPTSRRVTDHQRTASLVAIHDVRDCRIRIENFHPCGACCPSGDDHHDRSVDRVADRRNDVQNEDSWGFEALFRRLFCAFQLIQ